MTIDWLANPIPGFQKVGYSNLEVRYKPEQSSGLQIHKVVLL